jgi:ribosomal protein S18 acetylase RimI-like enzyme
VEGTYGPSNPRPPGNALVAAGHAEMDLFVTEANEPATALYRKLGFRQVD